MCKMIRWQGRVLNFLYKLAGSVRWVSRTSSRNNNNYRILFCFQVILQITEQVSYQVPFVAPICGLRYYHPSFLFPKVHRRMFNLILPVLNHTAFQVTTSHFGDSTYNLRLSFQDQTG